MPVRCAEIDCVRVATCAFPESKRSRFCNTHKKSGMIIVLAGCCNADGCDKQPSFGFPGKKPRFCATHKFTGMADVKNKRCEANGCGKTPNFAEEGQKPRFCAAHKQPNHVNVKGPFCFVDKCRRRRALSRFCVDHLDAQCCAKNKETSQIKTLRLELELLRNKMKEKDNRLNYLETKLMNFKNQEPTGSNDGHEYNHHHHHPANENDSKESCHIFREIACTSVCSESGCFSSREASILSTAALEHENCHQPSSIRRNNFNNEHFIYLNEPAKSVYTSDLKGILPPPLPLQKSYFERILPYPLSRHDSFVTIEPNMTRCDQTRKFSYENCGRNDFKRSRVCNEAEGMKINNVGHSIKRKVENMPRVSPSPTQQMQHRFVNGSDFWTVEPSISSSKLQDMHGNNNSCYVLPSPYEN